MVGGGNKSGSNCVLMVDVWRVTREVLFVWGVIDSNRGSMYLKETSSVCRDEAESVSRTECMSEYAISRAAIPCSWCFCVL